MNLISPLGVRVSVSDERGASLKAQGYKGVGDTVNASPTPAPASKTADSEAASDADDKPVKRRAPRKQTADNN